MKKLKLLSEHCFESGEVPIKTTAINPMEFIQEHFPDAYRDHITYDQNISPQYRIIRQQCHDGTLIFTQSIIRQMLGFLLRCESYYIPTKPKNMKDLSYIKYTIGDIEIKTAHGIVRLPVGDCPGQRERLAVPVKCEYVMAVDGKRVLEYGFKDNDQWDGVVEG